MLMRPLHNVLWNLFLALLPVFLAFFAARGIRGEWRTNGQVRWLRWLPVILLWLLFLPNTCYLLTEWRHYLQDMTGSQLFFRAQMRREDFNNFLLTTAFYLLYTNSGLLTFFLAIWPLDRLARRRLGLWRWVGQALVFLLCALGVYLGLINRLNSWDFLHPRGLIAIWHSATETLNQPVLLALILGFGLILWLLYSLFDIWMDGATWRLLRHQEQQQMPHQPASASSPALAASEISGDPAEQEDWNHASL